MNAAVTGVTGVGPKELGVSWHDPMLKSQREPPATLWNGVRSWMQLSRPGHQETHRCR